MSDFKIDLENNDLSFVFPDFELDDGLQTAVYISLFTDRRASAEEIDPGQDPRGTWFDYYENSPLGSKLWLLFRRKQDEETRDLAEQYSLEALNWLIVEGVAKAVSVAATFPRHGLVEIEVEITKPTGENINFKFAENWTAETGV